jgi:tRNA nucleotidyltransferase/poly(A) polymerase
MELLRRLAEFLGPRAAEVTVVGGCVRDRLLGRASHDIDLVLPEAVETAREFSRWARAAFVLLDDGRGTARVVDRGPSGDHLDFCQPAGTLEEDLWRRDFTIDAIACPLADWLAQRPNWLDPTGGLADLAARRLRAPRPDSLTADPLRVLRAHRLAAGLDLQIAPETADLMAAAAPGLAGVAAERVRQEWLTWLAAPAPAAEVARAESLGVLAAFLPGLALGAGERLAKLDDLAAAWSQPALDEWLAAADHLALARFAAVLGATTPTPRLALSRRERHLLAVLRRPPDSLPAAVLAAGDDVLGALVVAAATGALDLPAARAALARVAAELLPRYHEEPLIDGLDLQRILGEKPGPRFGPALAAARLGQIDGSIGSREAALARAREVLAGDG